MMTFVSTFVMGTFCYSFTVMARSVAIPAVTECYLVEDLFGPVVLVEAKSLLQACPLAVSNKLLAHSFAKFNHCHSKNILLLLVKQHRVDLLKTRAALHINRRWHTLAEPVSIFSERAVPKAILATFVNSKYVVSLSLML
jgi:hypothetical protein